MITTITTITIMIIMIMTAGREDPLHGTISPAFPAVRPAAATRSKYYKNRLNNAKARHDWLGFCIVFSEGLCYNSDEAL